jgi:hypothetical protein
MLDRKSYFFGQKLEILKHEIRNKQKDDAGFMIHDARCYLYILYLVSCNLYLLSVADLS